MANAAVPPLLADVDASLLEPPVNVLRLSLHPDSLAPRIVNLGQWRAHLLTRLQRDLEASADPGLGSLLDESRRLPQPRDAARTAQVAGAQGARPGHREPDPQANGIAASIVVPLQLIVDGDVLSFFSTTTVFGTPLDVTLAERAIESFFPADARTAQRLRNDREAGERGRPGSRKRTARAV